MHGRKPINFLSPAEILLYCRWLTKPKWGLGNFFFFQRRETPVRELIRMDMDWSVRPNYPHFTEGKAKELLAQQHTIH